MRFFLDNTELGLFPEETVEVQLNSPIKDMKMTGDKAHAFSVPNSPLARRATAGKSHLQSSKLPEGFAGRIQHGPIHLLEGETKLKASSDRALSFQMDVAPGNIPASFWNQTLDQLDLGRIDLAKKNVVEGIFVLDLDSLGVRSDNGLQDEFGDYWLRNASTFRLFRGVNIIWEHTVAFEGYDRDEVDDLILNDLKASAAQYNDDPVLANTEIYIEKDQFVFVSSSIDLPSNMGFSCIVRPYLLSDSQELGFGLNLTEFRQIIYESSADDIIGRDIQSLAAGTITDPFIFPTVFAPRFYSSSSVYYCGSVNHKNFGALQKNTFKLRTTYPWVPAFRWVWMMDQVLELFGYSREGDNWEDWAKFCFVAMKDFARQCPGLSIPYNVYPNEMEPAKYMPDFTIRDFFDEFAKSTGSMLVWDIARKKLRLKYLSDIASDPSHSLQTDRVAIIENRHDAITNYKLAYSGVLDDEYLTEELEVFLGKEDTASTAENLQEILQKVVPLLPVPDDYDVKTYRMYDRHPERNQEGWIGNPTNNSTPPTHFCYVQGKSVFFNLQATKPQVRSFYMDDYQVASSDVYSLDRSAQTGIFESLMKPLLDRRTGKTLKLKTYLSIAEMKHFNFEKLIHYKGLNFLLLVNSLKSRPRRKYLDAELELEVLR